MGAYIAPNIVNNAILKTQVGDEAFIKGNLKPLDYTQGVRNLEDTFSGFVLTMLLALAYGFIPSSFIILIIKERESNSKH